MLVINNISKTFDDKKVIDNCSLTIKENTVFGLIGTNGAGKSTLLRMIAGVYECDEGDIIFDGLNTFKDDFIRKDILYLNDNPYYSKTINLNGLRSFYKNFYEFDDNKFDKYCQLFKLDLKKPLLNFSKGMLRQAYLVVAMAISPKLLILDEAFDGLDPLVRLEFKESLINLINEKEITVIISSHNLRELEDICDSFGILENGKIKTSGNINEMKELINKYQLAFKDNIDKKLFENIDYINLSINGRVATLIIKGDKEEIIKLLETLNPLFIDVLNVDFEELFIYELENGDRYYE